MVYKSKFGYHPCSYETYKKLKFLNAFYVQALMMAGKWERWNRKAPHNRVFRKIVREGDKVVKREVILDSQGDPMMVQEPKYCSLFSTLKDRYIWHPGSLYYREGVYQPAKEIVTDKTRGNNILKDSRQARTPTKSETTENMIFDEKQIDDLYRQAKEWMKKEKQSYNWDNQSYNWDEDTYDVIVAVEKFTNSIKGNKNENE